MDTRNLTRKELLHQGKANNVYATSDPEVLELEASDRISAGNGVKTDVISGKGLANNVISEAIFKKLEELGIPTHYIEHGSTPTSKFVKKANAIPLEVIGRFYATGSFVKRYNVPDMMAFDPVFVEFTYKSDDAGDPPICKEAVVASGILTAREAGYVEYLTERVAHVIKEFFELCDGNLIDFKIEFGRLPNGQIIVIDEISPDTCRIRDKKTGESLDKDRFRKDLGSVAETYMEIAHRVASVSKASEQ